MTHSKGTRGDTQEDEPIVATVLNTMLDTITQVTTVTDTTREAPMVRVPVRAPVQGRYVEDLWVDDARVPVLARPR